MENSENNQKDDKTSSELPSEVEENCVSWEKSFEIPVCICRSEAFSGFLVLDPADPAIV